MVNKRASPGTPVKDFWKLARCSKMSIWHIDSPKAENGQLSMWPLSSVFMVMLKLKARMKPKDMITSQAVVLLSAIMPKLYYCPVSCSNVCL